jgi:uncharacterized protein YbjQ (UPF0145 family)
LRQLLDSVLVTTETSPLDLKITKRCGIVGSNVPDREQAEGADTDRQGQGSRLSLDDMYNVALLDLRYQALRLGANAVIAVSGAFAPPVQPSDTDLCLSLMGTAVYIEALREEGSA